MSSQLLSVILQAASSLSLLDMPVASPPMAWQGGEQPWDGLMDWSLPSGGTGAPQMQVLVCSIM